MVEKTQVVALQASVSDREVELEDQSKNEANVLIANQLKKEGKGTEMMPRSAHWAPITAQRYLDLHMKGGADDFFSSDWTDEELVNRLGHMSKILQRQVIVAFSGADEYVPKHVNPKQLSERLCRAMNGGKSSGVAQEFFLPSGNHNLSISNGDKERFVKRVAESLGKLP